MKVATGCFLGILCSRQCTPRGTIVSFIASSKWGNCWLAAQVDTCLCDVSAFLLVLWGVSPLFPTISWVPWGNTGCRNKGGVSARGDMRSAEADWEQVLWRGQQGWGMLHDAVTREDNLEEILLPLWNQADWYRRKMQHTQRETNWHNSFTVNLQAKIYLDSRKCR
jgi:hypothetical protein